MYENDMWGGLIGLALVAGLFDDGMFGNNRNNGGGYVTNDELQMGFFRNDVSDKLDGINYGICNLGYNLSNSLTQGFGGLNTALVTQGYESRLATQGLSSQLASCCCDLRQGQAETRYADLLNTKALQEQLSKCCCDNEKAIMQLNYNLAQQNCGTLQAIDKLGDRIIGYMSNSERQNLRDENFALRLKASQEAQNNYLISRLGRQEPIPSYQVPNPNCCYNNNSIL